MLKNDTHTIKATPENIRAWLKAHGRSYKWLAHRIRKGETTIGFWLKPNNPRPIPESQQVLIELLMEMDSGNSHDLSIDEWQQFHEIAEHLGLSTGELMTESQRDMIEKHRHILS